MDKTLVYQLYPRSWRGGLKAMEKHLDIIAELDADYVWLSPIYPSPGNDHGYDVSDYQDIDPRFGTFTDFSNFVKSAHDRGIGVLMDLIINHTSVEHPWFVGKPQYYCWSDYYRIGWRNLMDGGPAFKYDEDMEKFYVHLFHQNQADLNWFPDNSINEDLVEEFRSIVEFWSDEYTVDGFRLDAVQAINKDLESDTLNRYSLYGGEKATEVIQAIFRGRDDFLIAECFDSTMGSLTQRYVDAGVDFVLNPLLKEQAKFGEDYLLDQIASSVRNNHFMLDLESHDAPRLPSLGIEPENESWLLFNTGANGVCLYQGQELGLNNPTPDQLSDLKLIELDAMTAMRAMSGGDIEDLRPHSRANARVPIPLSKYEMQRENPSSYFNLTKNRIKKWREE